MGVAVKSLESFSKTRELKTWIHLFKIKKSSLKMEKRQDLRTQAVISSALSRAELELRTRQQIRRQRWEAMRSTWSADCCEKSELRPQRDWTDVENCRDLTSIDSFLEEISNVKMVLQT